MDLEKSVARHYTHGSLETAIFNALIASGKNLDALTSADQAPVDEFHIAGRQATADFASELNRRPGRTFSTSTRGWADNRATSRKNGVVG